MNTLAVSAPTIRKMNLSRQSVRQAEAFLQRGRLDEAAAILETFTQGSLSRGQPELYLEAIAMLIRIRAEQTMSDSLTDIEVSLWRLLETTELSLKSRAQVHQLLGLCALGSTSLEKWVAATKRLSTALELATQIQDHERTALALYGLAFIHMAQERDSQAKELIAKLFVILEFLDHPNLHCRSLILKSAVQRNEGQYDEALASAWQAYRLLGEVPDVILYGHTLYALGTIFLSQGQHESARHHFDLILNSETSQQLPRLRQFALNAMTKLGGSGADRECTLILDEAKGTVVKPNGAIVNLNGQFVLRDLLFLFTQNPDRTFSKEQIVREVWKQNYHPEMHDNKIYVTIRRLRSLIQFKTSAGLNQVITRSKEGYRLDPSLKISRSS